MEQDNGTDTRTGTTDNPTSSKRPYAPPPDNPGSAGQASRLESRARARETQQDNGSQPAQASESTGGRPRTETVGGRRETSEGGGADRPGTRDQQYRDMPGSPGQPSRLESRARAREAQQGSGSPTVEAKDTGSSPRRERDDRTATGQPGGERARTETVAGTRETTKDRDSGNDEDRTGGTGARDQQWRDMPGSPGQPSRLESRARARELQAQGPTHGRETSSGGTETPTERDARPAPPLNSQTTDKPGPSGQDTDADTGKAHPDDRERHDSGTATGERDQETPGGQASETQLVHDRERQPLPQQDAPRPDTAEHNAPDTSRPLDESREPGREQSTDTTDQATTGQDEPPADTSLSSPRSGDRTSPPTGGTEQVPPVPDGTTDKTPSPPDNRRDGQEAVPGTETTDRPTGSQKPHAGDDKLNDSLERRLGEELAELTEKKINAEIDSTLDKVNPKFDCTKSAYSENCTGVVQANELQRRGSDAKAGPLEKHLRTDEGGPGGRLLSVIEQAWGGRFVPGTKADIEAAFKEPGSRGIVYICWHRSGAHVFNVENVGGNVRFVDGQPTPSTTDASHYFSFGTNTRYLRLDNLPTPPDKAVERFLEP